MQWINNDEYIASFIQDYISNKSIARDLAANKTNFT